MDKEPLYDNSTLLENTFTNLELDLDFEKIYNVVDDEKLRRDLKEKKDLDNIRNENYKRYNEIDILKYEDLPDEFKNVSKEIIHLYNRINIKKMLTDNYEESINNRAILDNIYKLIIRLDHMVNLYVNELTIDNDEKQKRFDRVYFNSLNIDEKSKGNLINKYEDLILYSSRISKDLYEELHIQENREKYICEILDLISEKESINDSFNSNNALKKLNNLIQNQIKKYNDIIQYLVDLIPENSKYTRDFNEFRDLFNKIIAYDSTNLEVARQTYDILTDVKFIGRINSFEQYFIDERLYLKKEEEFVYKKTGIKNIKKTLKYIDNYYKDALSLNYLNLFNYVVDKLNGGNYALNDLNYKLKCVVRNIWSKTITDVYNYNPNNNYCFICSNNQFIDEEYQAILITKNELEKTDIYEDYQIGFICKYNDNILCITENENTVDSIIDDMSDLKTPIQLEQEFIDFKVCNRIILNGYKTKIVGVYFINDGDKNKYLKALELANDYKLPLIDLK